MRLLKLGTVWCGVLAYFVPAEPWGWAYTIGAAIGAFLWVTASKAVVVDGPWRDHDERAA